MKQVFKDRIGAALRKKLDKLDIGKERSDRIKEEYDDDFGINLELNGGVFEYRGNRSSLKDQDQVKIFEYDNGEILLNIDDDDSGKKQEGIFGYLEVADEIEGLIMENVTDIEKKLDILSAIIGGDDIPKPKKEKNQPVKEQKQSHNDEQADDKQEEEPSGDEKDESKADENDVVGPGYVLDDDKEDNPYLM